MQLPLHPIQQGLFPQPLTVDAGRLQDQAHFYLMLLIVALVIPYKPRDRQAVLRFHKIDQLPVCVCLEGSEGRQVIDGLQQAGLALCVAADQQHNPPGNVDIQAGEVAEVREREVLQVHGVVSAYGFNVISNSISSRMGMPCSPINGMLGFILLDLLTASRSTRTSLNPRF